MTRHQKTREGHDGVTDALCSETNLAHSWPSRCKASVAVRAQASVRGLPPLRGSRARFATRAKPDCVNAPLYMLLPIIDDVAGGRIHEVDVVEADRVRGAF